MNGTVYCLIVMQLVDEADYGTFQYIKQLAQQKWIRNALLANNKSIEK